MPYKSERQRRFFHSAGAAKAGITTADVSHWDEASKGLKLPEKAEKSASVMLSSFLDELRKIAALHQDQVGDVKIFQDPSSFASKLRPGDVIVTRGGGIGVSKLISAFQKAKGMPEDKAMWTHAGIYIGDGKLRHSHLPVKGRGLGWSAKVRDHQIGTIQDLGADFLALRPDVSKEERQEAVDRSTKMLGKRFSIGALLRAGILPKTAWKSRELKDTNLPENVICTSVVGYSYPKIQFGPVLKSIHHLMPAEIVGSPKLTPIAALSSQLAAS